ncbi:TetR family transcriptional regulator C-terminal domain-containing protein [Candidatus Uabimicrobium sp. HlEnr_7]|uniref:TetR/AcrR family transcriptional regulator n=1 Tax=Candidatus Uabimicrobium helgolandensis TaxID=3095367 RepID=UPI003555F582
MAKSKTRQKLIEVGTQAIINKSYHAVGIQEILTLAQVPKGSFYYYFKSKEDFGIAVIEYHTTITIELMRSFLSNRKQKPLQRMRDYFEAGRQEHAKNFCKHGCLLGKLGSETTSLNPSIRATLKCCMDQWLALFALCIREAQEVEQISQNHCPERLAEFILDSWQGAVTHVLINQNLKPLDNFFHYTFDHILNYSST